MASAKGGVRWWLLLLLVVLGLLIGAGLYTASRFAERPEPAPPPESRVQAVRQKVPAAPQPALKKASPPSAPKLPAPEKPPVSEKPAAPENSPPPAKPPSKPPVRAPAKPAPKEPALPEPALIEPPLTVTQDFQPAPPEADDTTIPADTPAGPSAGGEVPDSLRQVLKTLKINVHLYDADPDKRIVFINARRYKSGDRIWGTNLVLKQIIPEGVALAHNGQEVILRYR